MTATMPHLEPGPDHPISLGAHPGHVTITAGSTVVAETDRALDLREANYATVVYVPLEDVRPDVLRSRQMHTYCPYKGQASYYDLVPQAGDVLDGAVWYYPDPYPAVSAIRDHVAFYANRVTISSGS